jgi:hypothetical protein
LALNPANTTGQFLKFRNTLVTGFGSTYFRADAQNSCGTIRFHCTGPYLRGGTNPKLLEIGIYYVGVNDGNETGQNENENENENEKAKLDLNDDEFDESRSPRDANTKQSVARHRTSRTTTSGY